MGGLRAILMTVDSMAPPSLRCSKRGCRRTLDGFQRPGPDLVRTRVRTPSFSTVRRPSALQSTKRTSTAWSLALHEKSGGSCCSGALSLQHSRDCSSP